MSTTARGTWQPSAMFDGPGDSSPNAVFDYVKETNRQSRNLGPALVRLVSTDIQMIRGSAYTSLPSGISRWGNSDTNGSSLKWQNSHTANTGGYTDYITTITPYTNSTANGGTVDSSYSDILVGYFNPLLSNNPGCTFVDGLHFMIVNGAASGTAAAAAQWYHLTFDFTGSDFDSLVRLSRDTGKVELVPLTSTGGSNYYLDLNLPGGTGDLFAFLGQQQSASYGSRARHARALGHRPDRLAGLRLAETEMIGRFVGLEIWKLGIQARGSLAPGR